VVDGPTPVACAPTSGTVFPIGTTVVHCGATDSHTNHGDAPFNITVADTTPPVLIVPGDTSVYATTPDGAPADSKGAAVFLQSVSASDSVDAAPKLTNNAPSFFPVGITFVPRTAKAASGSVTANPAKVT